MPPVLVPALAAGASTALAGGFGAAVAAGSISAFAGGVSLAAVAASAGLAAASAGLQLATAQKSGGIGPTSSFVQRTPVFLPDVYGECRVGAAAAYYRQSTDASNNDLLTVWVLAAHAIEEVLEIRYGDQLVWTPSGVESAFDGRITIAVQLGHDATPTPPADLLAGASGVLDGNFKLKGKPYVYIRFRKVTGRKTNWPQGIDPGRLWFRVKGKRVYDPRTDATAYSANWALCFRDWLINRGGLTAAHFSAAQIEAAANLCDEDVSLGGSPETFLKRYEVNGAFRSEIAPRDLIGDWLRQGGNLRGLVNTGAALHLVPGSYTAPVASFGPDDFLDPVRLEPEAKVEDRFDGVQATFARRSAFFNASQGNRVILSDYAGDPDDARILELEYARETRSARATRLGLLALRQSRRVQKISFSVPLSAANAALLPGQRVGAALAPAGIDGTFEIVERRTVLDPERPRVEIVALEDDADFWGWTSATATTAPDGLNSTLPDPFFVQPATGVTATAFSRVEPDGSVTRWIDVSWTAPAAEPFLDGYRVEWVQGGETRDAETTATRYRINNLAASGEVTVAVFVVNTLGRESAGASPGSGVTPGGDATPPGPPPSGAIFPVAGGFRFVVGNPTDADLAGLRLYEGASGAAFGATSAVRDVPATPGGEDTEFRREGIAADTTRRYFITAFDRTGNESSAFGPLEATTPPALTTEEIDAAIAAAEAIATEALADAEAALTQVGVVTSAVSDVEADLAAEVTNRIAAIATETSARAASEQALEARVSGPNLVARGAVNAASTQAQVNEAWTGVILASSGATNFALLQDGRYLQVENGDRSRVVHRYNPNGRKFRATGIAFNPSSPGSFLIGLRRPDSMFLNGNATVRTTGATFWQAFDVEWTCASDAPDFVVGFYLAAGHFAGVADLVVTDVTDTDATTGAASIRNLATTKVDAAGAVAAVNSVVAAEGAPGIATVQALTTAYSLTEGALGAAYMLRAKAGGSAAEFELVAFDDVQGGGSAIRLDADLIILDGTVTADKLNVTDLSAISANLGSIVVGEANIGSLAVTTLKIAGEAITTAKIGANQVTRNYEASGTALNSSAITVNMNRAGEIVASVARALTVSVLAGTATATLRLLIDGVLVASQQIQTGGPAQEGGGEITREYIALSGKRNVGAGNRVVRVEVTVSGGTAPSVVAGPFVMTASGFFA